MVTNKELMKQRAEEADRMIAEIAAPQPPVEESPVTNELAGATEAAQPTDAIEATPEDQGAELIATSQEPAVSEDELTALQSEVESLKTELSKSEQRYRTLQGMLNAREQDITELRKVIATLGEKPVAAEPVADITNEDKETYGEDLINLIKRVTKAQVAPLFNEVDSRVQSVAQVATTSAMQRFEADLAAAVPDWEDVNNSPEFVAWLGKYNLKALNEAYNAMDLQGTAQFFLDFKKLSAPAPAPVAEKPAPAPVVDKLEHLAAPTRSKVTPINPDANRGRIWSRADVAQLYRDHAAKRISSAEFDKLEADLFKAQTEGRVAA